MASVTLINLEDDTKAISWNDYEKEIDPVMKEKTGREVKRIKMRHEIVLGAACDRDVSGAAMRDGRKEGKNNPEGDAAWHPEKTVTSAEYAAILAGPSGSVVKGWITKRQIEFKRA